VFLWEALLLSFTGSGCGLLFSEAVSRVLPDLVPELTRGTPAWAAAAALAVALAIGVGFGVAPARRAARLDPVLALARR
jgi:putative ABC transport system permease protein